MALDIQTFEGLIGLYFPDSKNIGNSLFSFTATTNFSTGKPILFAINPPVRFPKLPQGTEKIIFLPFPNLE